MLRSPAAQFDSIMLLQDPIGVKVVAAAVDVEEEEASMTADVEVAVVDVVDEVALVTAVGVVALVVAVAEAQTVGALVISKARNRPLLNEDIGVAGSCTLVDTAAYIFPAHGR